jgi:hypothetical protein
MKYLSLIILVLLLCGQAAWAQADEEAWSFGPLGLFSQAPLRGIRLGLFPRPVHVLKPGRYAFAFTESCANYCAKKTGIYSVDFERLHTDLSVSYGLPRSLEIEAGLEDFHGYGGFMDSFISGFHDMLGMKQTARESLHRNELDIAIYDPAGGSSPLIVDGEGEYYWQSLRLGVRKEVAPLPEGYPVFNLALTGRFNLNMPEIFRKCSDAYGGVSFAASQRAGAFSFSSVFSASFFGKSRISHIRLRREQFACMFSIEWRYMRNSSLVLQSGLFQGISTAYPFNRTSQELVLGWKQRLAPGLLVEFGLVENFRTYDLSPDLAIYTRLTWLF